MKLGIGEERHDVLEHDAFVREVGVLYERFRERHFKTGEFGGTGGIGGGDCSFGGILLVVS